MAGRIIFILSIAFLSFFTGALLTYQKSFPYGFMFQLAAGKTALQEMVDAWVDEHSSGKESKLPTWTIKKYDQKQPLNGYTLVCPTGLSLAQLIDMNGKVVHSWQTDKSKFKPTFSRRLTAAYLYPNGDLLTINNDNSDSKRWLVKLDKNSNVIWKYKARAHHDVQLDEYGNVYTLIEPIDNKKPDGAAYFNTPFLHDYIVMLSPDGKEIKRISIIKAFLNSPFASYMKKINFQDKKGDFLHNNTVNVLSSADANAFPQFKAGFILISVRNIHTIAVIDPQTEQVVWAKTGIWRWQHNPQFMPSGHIRLLDNQGAGKRRSRILEINVPSGEVVSNPAIDSLPFFYTKFKGSFEMLANGNILIMASGTQRVMEADNQGHLLWDAKVSTKFVSSIECAHRYTAAQLPFLKR